MRRWALAAIVGGLASGCRCSAPDEQPNPPPAAAPIASPRVLFVADGGDVASSGSPPAAAGPVAPPPSSGNRCPAEMVDVEGRFCVDRWEASLEDERGRAYSPYYSPLASKARSAHDDWATRHATIGPESARAMDVPELPSWQLQARSGPRASSKAGKLPNGYLDGETAEASCERAGKRLCTAAEWITACKGQQRRKFPYGDRYVQGICNVFREAHPAAELHGDASIGHMDPRLNQVQCASGPLLRRTGETSGCKSQWGNDAIYDMVGNLDEWVADSVSAFQGGFFSRSTREGCESRVTAHPRQYADYSLGMRCCK